MEIQIRIKSENEYFCVLIFVCLSDTIIVEKENETKTCKRSFYLQSNRQTARVEISVAGNGVIGLETSERQKKRVLKYIFFHFPIQLIRGFGS